MKKDMVLVACATDDLENLIEDHFGEARYFMIFRVEAGKWEHLENIANRTVFAHDHPEDERAHGRHGHGHNHSHGHGHGHGHGEGAKARAILEHFREREVDVFISRRFGPNIVVIREYVLPVVIREAINVKEALSLCRKNYPELIRQIALPKEKRRHLVFTP